MSELKVRPYTMLPSGQCYDRDEVDKVIAAKDAEIAQLQAMLEERNSQIAKLTQSLEQVKRAERTWNCSADATRFFNEI